MKTITITAQSIIQSNDMFDISDIDFSSIKTETEKLVRSLNKNGASDINVQYNEKELKGVITYN